MRLGLCSVTYRQLSPEQIIALVGEAGGQVIEWGSDVHVPADDLERARAIGRATRDAGLEVCSYGTYWRAGTSTAAELDALLTAAAALGTDRLRVWPGSAGSAESDDATRTAVTDALRRAVARAAETGMSIAVECHPNTLTDTPESMAALLDAVPGLAAYWQPGVDQTQGWDLDRLDRSLDRVVCGHVFAWSPDHDRRPLLVRQHLWRPAVARLVARPMDLLIEFVPGDEPAVLAREIATLRQWVDLAHADVSADRPAGPPTDLVTSPSSASSSVSSGARSGGSDGRGDRAAQGSTTPEGTTLLLMDDVALVRDFTPARLEDLAAARPLHDPVNAASFDDPDLAPTLSHVATLVLTQDSPVPSPGDLSRMSGLRTILRASDAAPGIDPQYINDHDIRVGNIAQS